MSRYKVEHWVHHCDHCREEMESGEGITGLSSGRSDYAIFETPWGMIYADEDNCWCSIECLCLWLEEQVNKLREVST